MATKEIRGLEIDAKEFRYLANALKKASKEMYLQLKRDLKATGEIVAKDARIISSRHSSTIPPTIKTRVRGLTVYVEAGGNFGGVSDAKAAKEIFSSGYGTTGSNRSLKRLEEGVVIAGLFEAGNKGGSKSAASFERGVFRHPVFGTDDWTDQDMYPYLVPAFKKNEAAVLALLVESLSKITEIICVEK